VNGHGHQDTIVDLEPTIAIMMAPMLWGEGVAWALSRGTAPRVPALSVDRVGAMPLEATGAIMPPDSGKIHVERRWRHSSIDPRARDVPHLLAIGGPGAWLEASWSSCSPGFIAKSVDVEEP